METTANELDAGKQSRTTADLLNWADDVAGISSSLQGTSFSSGDELDSIHLDDPAISQALATIAQRLPRQEMTSREAAAEALLKAARHGRGTRHAKDTPSRYMDSKLRTSTPRVDVLRKLQTVITCKTEAAHCMAASAGLLDAGSCKGQQHQQQT